MSFTFTTITDSYSDVFLACPSDVENGPKEALVATSGRSERMASDHRTGEWSGGSFQFELIDDGRFRRQQASFTDRYWDTVTVKMTTRGNRAIKGPWYVVHHGPVVEAKPIRPKGFRITLGDIVSRLLITDDGAGADVPFRKIGDGFIDDSVGVMLTVDEHLDRDTPEPQVYGSHRRVPDIDPASPQGFCVLPIYLGTRDLSGNDYHVWMIAGHAVSDIPAWHVISPDGSTANFTSEGSDWIVSHHAGHTAEFGAPYEDLRSATYGIDRRYTLFYGLVTDPFADVEDLTDPDACALGHKQLLVAVDGVEDVGDGSGVLITDRIQQYKHWLINYVANAGLNGYQSGNWLTNPTWDLFGSTVDVIDEDSFDACSAIAALRLPSNDYEPTAGYIGAAVIGQSAGDTKSVKSWIAEWNRSCGLQHCITRKGQYKVFMLSPTQAIKDAAPFYNDQNHIIRNSFEEDLRYPEQANVVPFQADFNPGTGVWVTRDTFTWPDSIEKEQRSIPSEVLNYRFAPGITQSYHLARIEGLRSLWAPKVFTIETNLLDKHNDSLAYREIGDYITYQSRFAIANSTGEIRLAQVQKLQVLTGERKVLAECLDCEDLIGAGGALSYDRPPQEAGEPGTTTNPPGGTVTPLENFTAFDAVVLNPETNSYEVTVDTSFNPTDTNAPAFGTGPGIAYHASWFAITPTVDKEFSFSTLGSSYDTQIAVFTADPADPYGTMVEVAYNDNLAPTNQSVVTLDLTADTTYYILVAGVGAFDGGTLRFRAVAPEVGDIYVSTAGSDSGTGAIDDPFRTIAYAVSRMSVGQVLIVRGGNYYEDLGSHVWDGMVGTSWATTDRYRIAAFPGELVWVVAPAGTNGIQMGNNSNTHSAYIEFDGINIDWSSDVRNNCGIKVVSDAGTDTEAHHIRFMNLEVKGAANTPLSGVGNQGVLIGASDTSFEGGCEFINLRVHGGGANDFEHGFYIGQKDVLIDGCEVWDITGAGIQVQYETSSNVTVRNNYIHDLRATGSGQRHWGIVINNGYVSTIGAKVYNNLVVRVPDNNGSSMGINIYTGTDSEVYNNTVVDCDAYGIYIGSNSSGVLVKNNIVYGSGTQDYVDEGASGTVLADNLFGIDPLFVNAGTGDFRLSAGSPAIDAGATIGIVATDRFGIPRPQGGAYDIGAHEYVTP